VELSVSRMVKITNHCAAPPRGFAWWLHKANDCASA